MSKTGYRAAFSDNELAEISEIKAKIIALGGVTPERIGLVCKYGFSGFAMLGSLPWAGTPAEMSRFISKTIKETENNK